ncbi:lysylphosphatidylglycerol synthase transmembrane domain-containing protein [Natrinema salaciae]|uniref:Lysylphosphatidylglycerol synthase TM region n=1 Tax=Natrinema salaciae TaxID=1186196 RepID=A0A1H9MVS1_9EURY|nr:lysylphosphatidylglycerol synthase transmembrane domain-containing protein [Natrinema salaciae]SER27515.1 conserved hypothetical protein [Natrinema salaciae]
MVRGSPSGRKLRQALSFVFGSVIIALLVWYTGYREFVTALNSASLPLILLGVIIYLLSWPVRIIQMYVCLLVLRSKLGARDLFEINIAGYAINVILPAKIGDVARAVYLTQEGVPIDRAVATITYIRIADLAGVTCLALFTASFIETALFPSWLQRTFIGVVALLMMVLTFAIISRYADGTVTLTTTWTRMIGLIESRLFHNIVHIGGQITVEFDRLVFSPYSLFTTAITSVIIWILEALTAYVIALSLGFHTPVITIVFAVSVANMTNVLPLTPGSLGVYEAAFTASLGLFGLTTGAVVAVALLEHALKNLFLVAVGIPIATQRGTGVVLEW